MWDIRKAITAGIAAAVSGLAILTLVAWLILRHPKLPHPGSLSLHDSVSVLQLVFASVAGAGALVGLIVAYRRQKVAEADSAHDHTRVYNERFTTIATQLGDDKPAAVRLAGVHAMAGLADDWKPNRQTCIDVLCAYLRIPYEPDPGDQATPAQQIAYRASREVRHSVIRIIAAHLREDAKVSWQGMNFDFTGATFDGGDFTDANFSSGRADFDRAIFASGEISFGRARFSNATVTFGDAEFSGGGVDFTATEFSGGTVDFGDAEFSGGTVDFSGASFSGGAVKFHRAKFSGGTVDLSNAGFFDGTVDFHRAKFSGGTVDFRDVGFFDGTVSFRYAEFSGGTVDFSGARFTGGTVGFGYAEFSGGTVDFGRVQFTGGTVDFGGARFFDGTVAFNGARFSGGTVNFGGATFSGGTVDFTTVIDWSNPPSFDQRAAPSVQFPPDHHHPAGPPKPN